MRVAFIALIVIALSGCNTSPTKREAKVVPAGEKARVADLVYAVVDTRVVPSLGDDPATARMPANRFYLVQMTVSNSSNTLVSVPGMSLVDDEGKTYPELADGTGLTKWLGVIRRIGPGETEQGQVLFDAPATHMRLKLTDETDPADVLIDIPLNLVHEDSSIHSEIPSAPLPPPAKK